MNIATFSNVTNLSYATWNALNNGSYLNAAETDPRWTANYTAFNATWSNTFNATTNQTITNALNAIASIGEPNWNANYSTFLTHINWNQVMNGTLAKSSELNNGTYANVPETDPYWRLNYTNMQNPCTPNFVTGIYTNGTFICGTVEQASETDPYWTANYTAFNSTWSYT